MDGSSLDAELTAREKALASDKTWISPYNDPAVIAGQGTIGLELAEQIEPIDRIFITVGGGGLVSGVAVALKHIRPGGANHRLPAPEFP